jgi:hypothetical protein
LTGVDVVFSGTPIDAEYPPPRRRFDEREGRFIEVRSSNDPVRWRFRVNAFWKGGEARDEIVEVVAAMSEASCGYEFELRQRYLVFATRSADGTMSTGLCTRTSRWDEALIERHALGQPLWSAGEFEAPPTLNRFESMLFGEDEQSRQIALEFWSDSDCGRNFLAWHLDQLDLPALQRRYLEEEVGSVSTRPGAAGAGPAPVRAVDWNYRVCTASERSWVRARINDRIFMPLSSEADKPPPPNPPPQAGEG